MALSVLAYPKKPEVQQLRPAKNFSALKKITIEKTNPVVFLFWL